MDPFDPDFLKRLDGLPLECDGLTRALSRHLNRHGVKHTVWIGQLHALGHGVPVHYWIVLDDGRTIDFRARMWLGDLDSIPHGIFRQADYPDVRYLGEPIELNPLPGIIMQILTEGLIKD